MILEISRGDQNEIYSTRTNCLLFISLYVYKTSSKTRGPTFLFLFVIKLHSMAALTGGEAELKSHLGSTTKHMTM